MINKNPTKTFLNRFSLFTLITIALVACKKDNGDLPSVANARVSLLIASPGANELSFFVNDKKSTTSPLLYNTVVNYMSVSSGAQELIFKNKEATETLAKTTANLKSNSNYTLIFTDKFPKIAAIFVEDDLSETAKDKAKVRFANLSPDAPAFDLYINGKLELTFSKKNFKEVSNYLNIDPGNNIKFELKENGKTEVLSTLENFNIQSGRIYTLWARGIKELNTTNTLGLEAMTNR